LGALGKDPWEAEETGSVPVLRNGKPVMRKG